MPTLEEELKELKANKDKAEAAKKENENQLKAAQSSLTQINNECTSLTSRIAVLEQVQKNLENARTGIQTAQEKGEADLAAASKSSEQLLKHIEAALPEDQRTVIRDRRKAADGSIEEAKKKVGDIEKKKEEAEAKLTAAKKKSSDADANYRQTLREYVQLPNQMELTSTQINKLLTDTKAALDAGKPGDAYLSFLETTPSIESLTAMVKKETSEKLAASVAERRQIAAQSQNELKEATDSLKELTDSLAAAQTDLKNKEQSRQSDLKPKG